MTRAEYKKRQPPEVLKERDRFVAQLLRSQGLTEAELYPASVVLPARDSEDRRGD